MARGELAGDHPLLHGLRQFEEAHDVGEVRPALADHLAELLLGVLEVLEEPLVAGGLLDGIEIRALDVFEDRVFERGLVVHVDDHHRDVVEARGLGGAPTALAGDDLVGVRGRGDRAHHHGLDDAAFADRGG
jgi:hypothetical protein